MGSRASLDRSPKSNWVEHAGELPGYIRELARAIERTGKTLSHAIAIAISRCKVWATGKGVSAKTQAKAAAAVVQWEALKAKSGMKSAVRASVFDEMDAAADLVVLTPFEDVFIQATVSSDEKSRSVALSRVLEMVGHRSVR